MTYRVAQLDDIEVRNDGREPWRGVRHHLGITAFGVNAWTGANAGDRILNEHAEAGPDDHDEMYVVLDGRARFEIDGEEVDAPAGTVIHVPRGLKRTAFAEAARTTVLAYGASPDKAYEPDGWELWAPFHPLYEAGDYAAAADRAREVLDAEPPYAGFLFNLACCESLAGRPADAIAHLRQSIERSERFRELARNDSDFDPIREEPGFKELVGGSE
jgi:mannose-6-phosphate isomerase-like protein (cupin superfamily)